MPVMRVPRAHDPLPPTQPALPDLRTQFTLEESAYVEIMVGKKTSAEEATAHFKRMRACLGELS